MQSKAKERKAKQRKAEERKAKQSEGKQSNARLERGKRCHMLPQGGPGADDYDDDGDDANDDDGDDDDDDDDDAEERKAHQSKATHGLPRTPIMAGQYSTTQVRGGCRPGETRSRWVRRGGSHPEGTNQSLSMSRLTPNT